MNVCQPPHVRNHSRKRPFSALQQRHSEDGADCRDGEQAQRRKVTKALRLRWHHAVGTRRPMMSKWQAEKAERNRQSLARLNRTLSRIFPPAVLSWALAPFCTADAAARGRFVLACPSDPR